MGFERWCLLRGPECECCIWLCIWLCSWFVCRSSECQHRCTRGHETV